MPKPQPVYFCSVHKHGSHSISKRLVPETGVLKGYKPFYLKGRSVRTGARSIFSARFLHSGKRVLTSRTSLSRPASF